MNREAWLTAGVVALTPLFKEHGYDVPANLRVSCGWPSKGGLGKRKRVIGQCWAMRCSKDETWEIFISPSLSDPAEVLAILVHEIVHAVVGLECGHKGAFRKCAVKLGLVGLMTATVAGPELMPRLNELVKKLGTYPHAILTGKNNGAKTQSTRLLKIVCVCGYTARVTQKWIDVGMPTCPCGQEMTTEEDD